MGKMNAEPWGIRRIRMEMADTTTIEERHEENIYGKVTGRGTVFPLSSHLMN